MYAGTTLLKHSGKHVGVHQKIDRVAHQCLLHYVPKKQYFPNVKEILYFEGNNGPDGIKRKGSAADEPWHFIDPQDPNDLSLLTMIQDHIHNLSAALKTSNKVRASFEAAWLAHAVVDGLTPAHHYPLGDKIEELWGKSHNKRQGVKDKLVIKGNGLKDTISKNWQYMGADGVFTAHLLFEAGVASAISTVKFKKCGPSKADITKLSEIGFIAIYKESIKKIEALKMYDNFGSTGWTWDLANETRKILIPEIIKTVTLAWYQAISASQE